MFGTFLIDVKHWLLSLIRRLNSQLSFSLTTALNFMWTNSNWKILHSIPLNVILRGMVNMALDIYLYSKQLKEKANQISLSTINYEWQCKSLPSWCWPVHSWPGSPLGLPHHPAPAWGSCAGPGRSTWCHHFVGQRDPQLWALCLWSHNDRMDNPGHPIPGTDKGTSLHETGYLMQTHSHRCDL